MVKQGRSSSNGGAVAGLLTTQLAAGRTLGHMSSVPMEAASAVVS